VSTEPNIIPWHLETETIQTKAPKW